MNGKSCSDELGVGECLAAVNHDAYQEIHKFLFGKKSDYVIVSALPVYNITPILADDAIEFVHGNCYVAPHQYLNTLKFGFNSIDLRRALTAEPVVYAIDANMLEKKKVDIRGIATMQVISEGGITAIEINNIIMHAVNVDVVMALVAKAIHVAPNADQVRITIPTDRWMKEDTFFRTGHNFEYKLTECNMTRFVNMVDITRDVTRSDTMYVARYTQGSALYCYDDIRAIGNEAFTFNSKEHAKIHKFKYVASKDADAIADILQGLALGAWEVYIAYNGKLPIGILMCSNRKHYTQITTVYVKEGYRERGIGGWMLSEALASIAADVNRSHYVKLAVYLPKNKFTDYRLDFYNKYGFYVTSSEFTIAVPKELKAMMKK